MKKLISKLLLDKDIIELPRGVNLIEEEISNLDEGIYSGYCSELTLNHSGRLYLASNDLFDIIDRIAYRYFHSVTNYDYDLLLFKNMAGDRLSFCSPILSNRINLVNTFLEEQNNLLFEIVEKNKWDIISDFSYTNRWLYLLKVDNTIWKLIDWVKSALFMNNRVDSNFDKIEKDTILNIPIDTSQIRFEIEQYSLSVAIRKKITWLKFIIASLPNSENEKKVNVSDDNKILVSFKNNFDSVEIENVYDFFNKNLVEKKYISSEELLNYLDYAFNKIEQPKNKFAFKKEAKRHNIIPVFYEYYSVNAGKPHGKQIEYVKLLSDYFKGFTLSAVKNNFSKQKPKNGSK